MSSGRRGLSVPLTLVFTSMTSRPGRPFALDGPQLHARTLPAPRKVEPHLGIFHTQTPVANSSQFSRQPPPSPAPHTPSPRRSLTSLGARFDLQNLISKSQKEGEPAFPQGSQFIGRTHITL